MVYLILQFVGRERNLKFLEGVYSSGELELLVVSDFSLKVYNCCLPVI